MAFGLYVTPDGLVMVSYGERRIPIPCAQYRANGYKPALEKLAVKPFVAQKPEARPRPLISEAAACPIRPKL